MARRVASKPGQAPPRPHRPASALAHIAAELLNFACNSPATISNIEFTALKSQRFQTLLNLHLIELHATFEEAQAPPAHGYHSRVLRTPNVLWLVVLGFWGAPLCVVTNVVNRRCFSCGFLIRCYKRRQSDGFFAENQGFWTQIDDVCNMSTRKAI